MKKYLVKCTNHGFKGRYWVEGQIVSFEDNVVPNKHFELITPATKLPVPESHQITPAALSQARAQQAVKEPTAAQALKDQSEQGIATKPLSDVEKDQLKNLDEGSGVAETSTQETTKPADEGQGSI